MIAARLHGPGGKLVVEDVPTPSPERGEVLVRVVAAGICGSDLHILEGDSPLDAYPRVLGHEIAGVVERVGYGVADWRPGDRVCVDFLVSCGECDRCRQGRESLCRTRAGLGAQRDGGFAEYVCVPARNLVRVPETVPLAHAALATDALATPYHAIDKRAHLRPGQGVAVIGLGGLGLNALELLGLYNVSPLIAFDVDPGSRARAEAAAACDTFDPREYDVRQGLGLRRIETVLDFVGSPETVEFATRLVDRGGRVVVVGLSHENLELTTGMRFVRDEVELVGSYAFEREEIREIVAHLASGRLDVAASITHRVPLEEINRGVEILAARTGAPGRIVVEVSEDTAGGRVEEELENARSKGGEPVCR